VKAVAAKSNDLKKNEFASVTENEETKTLISYFFRMEEVLLKKNYIIF